MKSHLFRYNIIEEEPPNFFLLHIGLYLLSGLYISAVRLRNWLYRVHILKSKKLSVPVISVGNITVGGTGKTPVVQFLARSFQPQGKKVAILSRGYKRKNNQQLILVSNYEQVLADWEAAGDEPELLAQSLPGVAVVVGNERRVTGDYAIRELKPDLIILDDGFSHQQVARDVNLVLLDATRPFGNDYYLPAGLLREPISSLNRADIILLTRTKPGINYSKLLDRIRQIKPDIPIFFARTIPSKLIEISSQVEHPISELLREPIFVFAGIANPTPFRESFQELNAAVKRFIPFPDHYVYTKNDIIYLLEQAKQNQCRYLITTQKDAVKLKRLLTQFPEQNHRFIALDINIEVQKSAEFYLTLTKNLS